MYVENVVLVSGYAETIRAIFPPFPVPGFTPDFSGYDLDQQNIDWLRTYLASAPNDLLGFVSHVLFTFSFLVHSNKVK